VQGGLELVEHALHAVLLDTDERLTIDARRTTVLLHPMPCCVKDVTPPHPI
jgi:hypothetical protein